MRFGLIACLLFLLGGCRGENDSPGYIVLPGMHESVPHEAYDQHPELGPTLREPPEGTIPYGKEPFPYGAGREEAERAGRQLENPLSNLTLDESEKAVSRGQHLYNTFCLVCHGPAGEGDGPIIGRFPNPPSLLSPKTKSMRDGQLFHVTTRGQGLMAAYATQVEPMDRWRLVLYLRKLQGITPDNEDTNAQGAPPFDAAPFDAPGQSPEPADAASDPVPLEKGEAP